MNLRIRHLELSCDVIKPFEECFRSQKVPNITLLSGQQIFFFDDARNLRTHLPAKNTRSINRLDPKTSNIEVYFQ